LIGGTTRDERTIQRGWQYYSTPEGVELASIIVQDRLRIRGKHEQLDILLATLRDGVPVDTVAEELAARSGYPVASVRRLLQQLWEHNALVETPHLVMDLDNLYDRQIRFLSAFETTDTSGIALNARLQDRTVLIVGMGGYGTWLALLCARMGIRRIIAIDPDHVETSNLSRQILYTRHDVGSLKVDACKRALADVDDAVSFEGHPVRIASAEDLIPYLDGVDLTLNSFGYIPNYVLESIALASGRAGVPSLLLGASWVGPLTIPGETACYYCLMSHKGVADVVKASMAQFATATPDRPIGAFVPRMAITASLAIWEAVLFLTSIMRTPTLDGVVTYDFFQSRRQTLIPIPRNEECEVCRHWSHTDPAGRCHE